MVRRNAQVGQESVEPVDSIIAEEVTQVSEIAAYESEAGVIYDVFLCVGVLIEAV